MRQLKEGLIRQWADLKVVSEQERRNRARLVRPIYEEYDEGRAAFMVAVMRAWERIKKWQTDQRNSLDPKI